MSFYEELTEKIAEKIGTPAHNAKILEVLNKELKGPKCIYCGFHSDTSDAMADHILTCEKSPLVQMINELREETHLLSHELCTLEDSLIGNKDFDEKGIWVDRTKKLKEKIRDLIAHEGELGDIKEFLKDLLNEFRAWNGEEEFDETSLMKPYFDKIKSFIQETNEQKDPIK